MSSGCGDASDSDDDDQTPFPMLVPVATPINEPYRGPRLELVWTWPGLVLVALAFVLFCGIMSLHAALDAQLGAEETQRASYFSVLFALGGIVLSAVGVGFSLALASPYCGGEGVKWIRSQPLLRRFIPRWRSRTAAHENVNYF